ncbi:GNAT family N-acetyltransferase [Homoserinimonas sp. OAct 916]|uniref:GNAT family N-acetyltransferase n=1 Tax=Homoserinimonas sp. OAct 916 TaxID=2211450 RepID=UPI000DBE41CE|nr:GNAT family protein [Homoserinimonas sp. OAct 916]
MLENSYPPFGLRVVTPRIELVAATDEILFQLAPIVQAGLASAEPPPYDDPISLYENDPEVRVSTWLQGIWRGRGNFGPGNWRLYFAVVLDGRAVGMQDLVGTQFGAFGSVDSFSWLSSSERRQGLGREMRSAILHLAFAGLDAKEAHSEAFLDNIGSNRVSEALEYEANGTNWATRRGATAELQRWKLSRERWQRHQRDDVQIHGLEPVRKALRIEN